MKHNTLSLLLLAATMGCESYAQRAADVRLECTDAQGWQFQTRTEQLAPGRELLHVTLDAPAPAAPPQFALAFEMPQQDIHHVWSTDYGRHCQIMPDWAGAYTSQLASNLPLYTMINDNNENRLTLATDEALRYVEARVALREEQCQMVCRLTYFLQPEAPLSHYEVTLLLDSRSMPWDLCVREGMDWMRQSAHLAPCRVPEAAEEPLYSTWYQFHQAVFADQIEAECRLASELGMKTIIVDDGWQTDDTRRGYAYCGDWQVSPRRFADMRAHVARVHQMGMKYMMWYSVPFVGIHSRNYERFRQKFLFLDRSAQAGVLDPRFPEVREFLVGLYEQAMRDWDLDGFKLDFIDSFHFEGEDPAVAEDYAGRDIKALPEAIDALMREVHDRLSVLKPDVLIEFRQSYIGPAICQYGNMLRSGDCPGDLTTNRSHIACLRLTSGSTAVHADMIEWNLQERPEDAARAILSAMYGVIQYSVMLRDVTPEHQAVIRHWLQFSQQHRQTLLHGEFRAYHPERDFPVLEAIGTDERIIGLYQDDAVAQVAADRQTAYVLNGTGSTSVILELEADARRVEVHDTYGTLVGTGEPAAGLHRVEVPRSGYLVIAL